MGNKNRRRKGQREGGEGELTPASGEVIEVAFFMLDT